MSELSVPMVMSFLEAQQGEAWESWRMFARELKPLKYKMLWRTASAKLHNESRERYGKCSLNQIIVRIRLLIHTLEESRGFALQGR